MVDLSFPCRWTIEECAISRDFFSDQRKQKRFRPLNQEGMKLQGAKGNDDDDDDEITRRCCLLFNAAVSTSCSDGGCGRSEGGMWAVSRRTGNVLLERKSRFTKATCVFLSSGLLALPLSLPFCVSSLSSSSWDEHSTKTHRAWFVWERQ